MAKSDKSSLQYAIFCDESQCGCSGWPPVPYRPDEASHLARNLILAIGRKNGLEWRPGPRTSVYPQEE